MTPIGLGDIPAGARVAVDANILLYHYAGASAECTAFLRRTQRGEVVGLLPTHIALEVLHRLMLIEALQENLTSGGNPARKLAEHPERVQRLTRSLSDFSDLPASGLQLVELDAAALARVPALCLRHGLLANDAALVAVAERHRASHLASADERLHALPGLVGCGPADLAGPRV